MKKRILSLVLALVMLASMMSVAFAASADYEFSYAYDCQRNPAYPNKNGEVELWGFSDPVTNKAGQGSDGNWSLTKVGAWKDFDQTNARVSGMAGSIATKYQIEKDDVEVWELKVDDEHIAYGILGAHKDVGGGKDVALFFGDTLSGSGAGFFLTDESMDGVSQYKFIAENTPNDNIVDPNAPQQPEQTTQDTPTVTPDTPTVTPPASRPNYDTSEEIVWQSGAKEESKANPATSDGFNTAVSAVMALSVLAGAAVVLGKKK